MKSNGLPGKRSVNCQLLSRLYCFVASYCNFFGIASTTDGVIVSSLVGSKDLGLLIYFTCLLVGCVNAGFASFV